MNYTQAIFNLLGWQGGTIHQLADVTGVDANSLLYGDPGEMKICSDSDWMKGQYAFSTCSTEFVRNNLLSQYKCCKDFWLGYMRAGYLKTLE